MAGLLPHRLVCIATTLSRFFLQVLPTDTKPVRQPSFWIMVGPVWIHQRYAVFGKHGVAKTGATLILTRSLQQPCIDAPSDWNIRGPLCCLFKNGQGYILNSAPLNLSVPLLSSPGCGRFLEGCCSLGRRGLIRVMPLRVVVAG